MTVKNLSSTETKFGIPYIFVLDGDQTCELYRVIHLKYIWRFNQQKRNYNNCHLIDEPDCNRILQLNEYIKLKWL
jgi:hypothetical protein